ncbi:MAG: ATP-dependent helicase [Pedobacter sp.]|nr:MAG: ATP-dependent helicase [Pedobacter sp.]
MQPTNQQQLILDHTGNAVVIAAPGSGKTYVVSEKVRTLLKGYAPYQGVIAISYTKKASGELKERCLKNGFDPKSSFFGTIDKFYLGEIIIPFGKHIWKTSETEFSVPAIKDMDEIERKNLEWVNSEYLPSQVSDEQMDMLKVFFVSGTIPLEAVGVLANYIFDRSKACGKYLKARYRAVFIDEYQDCGVNQHALFEKIVSLGITGVAVGDLNQSIYAFSGKSSIYLSQLTRQKNYKTFKLDKNHRCDNSIINYSNYLLDPSIAALPAQNMMVKSYRIEGNEADIARWMDKMIALFNARGIVNNQIVILTRYSRTATLISNNLLTSHKIIETTDLDTSLTIWSGIFANLLRFAFDPTFRFLEVVNDFIALEKLTIPRRQQLVNFRENIRTLFSAAQLDGATIVPLFIEVATFLAPKGKNNEAIRLLNQIFTLPSLLEGYKPSNITDVNIMTLHKSKGLEFDIVFHLDLHEWVFPKKKPGDNNDFKNPVFEDYQQDLNLHYVGITRARKCCLLVSSTQRTNAVGEIKNGVDSEFLYHEGIDKLRV